MSPRATWQMWSDECPSDRDYYQQFEPAPPRRDVSPTFDPMPTEVCRHCGEARGLHEARRECPQGQGYWTPDTVKYQRQLTAWRTRNGHQPVLRKDDVEPGAPRILVVRDGTHLKTFADPEVKVCVIDLNRLEQGAYDCAVPAGFEDLCDYARKRM